MIRFFSFLILSLSSLNFAYAIAPGVPGCEPESSFIKDPNAGVDPAFCAKWNPDFAFKGNTCCGKVPWKYRRRGIRCSPKRSKRSFCDERTKEQVSYTDHVNTGKIANVLNFLKPQLGINGSQATCLPTGGFLAYGKPILSTDSNGVTLRRPGRCVNFGTDRMIAMLEWLGREVKAKYQDQDFKDPHLLIGDMSAPRGGCLAGRGGRRGHLSHQTGQDVDIGFLYLRKKRSSPVEFTRRFQVEYNWWVLKKIFSNEFACVKIVLLDHRHIQKIKRHIKKIAKKNSKHPDIALWEKMKLHIQHVRYHRDHFHVRIDETNPAENCMSHLTYNDAT